MIKVGDTVKIKYWSIKGEVLAIKNKKVTIEIERGRMSGIPIETLELIIDKDVRNNPHEAQMLQVRGNR